MQIRDQELPASRRTGRVVVPASVASSTWSITSRPVCRGARADQPRGQVAAESFGSWAVDARLGARALGWLYLAGATIGLVSLLLPHPPHADVPGLYSNVGLAYAGGVGLMIAASRVRVWMLHAAIVVGSLVITRAVLLSGDSVSFYSVWFIWVGLYSFYFFGRRAAACHVALVAGLYAATLINDPPSSAVSRWLTTIATLVVAGGFIDTLVRHARKQAGAAAASADSMARVTEFAHDLAGLADSATARQALCSGTVRVTEADAGALWEPDDNGTGLHLTASTGRQPGSDAIPFAGPSHGATEAFATGRLATREPDAARDANEVSGHAGISLWQPIVREDLTVAILELQFADPGALEDQSVIVLTRLLAVEIAVTLQRVALLTELETKARTDELTGLPNRRAWHEQLPRELSRAARAASPLAVAMLDLDHFKRYNDTRGHQAGDRLLKEVSGAWNGELRPTDLLARYGGEEFALALPECAPEEALVIVERLRGRTPDGQTCSAGIVTWDGSETAAELLGRADQALYQAKRAGRNQSIVAQQTDVPR
jgi:diguanylate cyclase (GGDEF)-like protein